MTASQPLHVCTRCGETLPAGGMKCPRCGELPSTVAASTQAAASGNAAVVPPPSAPPLIAGRFQITAVIGQGGMGKVYKAYDKKLARTVAIKRLLPEISGNASLSKRFLIEARAIAALNHPNVVAIYDIFDEDADRFIVMEYVAGESLADTIRKKGDLSVDAAVQHMLLIGRALQCAHDRGVVHRDIKPSNILITTKGAPKIADFGLAQLATERDLTRTGSAMGTYHYAAPEQMQDAKRADHRADIYACGAMFYEMLTGESPRVIREMAVPESLRETVMRCLRPRPEDRFQSVNEMIAAISSAYRKSSIKAATPPALPPTPPPSPRRPPKTAAQAAGAVIWEGRAHPVSRLKKIALGLIVLAAVVLFGADLDHTLQMGLLNIQQEMQSHAAADADALDAAAWKVTPFLYALGILIEISAVAGAYRTRFTITASRLAVRRGLLFSRETDLPIDEMSEVQMRQGILGILLGYGEIRINRYGKMPILLQGVRKPEAFKEALVTRLGSG